MATKDTDETKKKVGEAAVAEVKQVEQPKDTQGAVDKNKTTNKNQTIITIAIISSVVLFFIGLGLGYVLGHTTADTDRSFEGGTLQRPGDGGGRRFYPNSGTNNSTDNSSDSSSSTTPQTQTN